MTQSITQFDTYMSAYDTPCVLKHTILSCSIIHPNMSQMLSNDVYMDSYSCFDKRGYEYISCITVGDLDKIYGNYV